MNIQKQQFKTESAMRQKPGESIVEGRLTLPIEKSDIQRVLIIHGKVHADATPSDGKVFMDGEVVFSVVYLATDGNLDCFMASSPFRHSEEYKDAGAGMNVYVKGSINEIEYSAEDSRSVYVKGIVSMSMFGSVSMPHEAVSDLDGMLVKKFNKSLSFTKEQRTETKMITEDIRVPQALPRVEKVLLADAYPVVKSVKTQELKIIVEGEIKMMVMYLSEDKNAPLQHFYESVPFGEIVSCENSADGGTAIADTDLYGVALSIAGDDILRLSAKLCIVCSVMGQEQREFVEDAFSLTCALNVAQQKVEHKTLALSGNAKAIARTNIVIPDSRPSVSRVVCVKASPAVLSATPGTDRVYAEGLMVFTVCYFSPEGMQSYYSDVPFEAEIQLEGLKKDQDVAVMADVEYCSYEGAGRDLSVKFMMDVTVKAFEPDSFSMVTNIEETPNPLTAKTGITIYFADGGESVWDIAKRYCTTPQTVEKFNPDIKDLAKKGQRILIMG